MEIYSTRDVETSCREMGTIRNRIDQWAAENGFVLVDDESGILDYKRGSHLKAVFSFLIRHIPTRVTVNINGADTGLIRCSIHISSPWSIETPGDAKRVEKILDSLVQSLQEAKS